MEKKCPICQTVLSTNCYIKDNGTATLSYLELIIKDDNLKKSNFELKSCYCSNCGHVEFYIDLAAQPQDFQVRDSSELEAVVQKFASEQQNRENALHKKKKS